MNKEDIMDCLNNIVNEALYNECNHVNDYTREIIYYNYNEIRRLLEGLADGE